MAAPIYSYGKQLLYVEEAGIKKSVLGFWKELSALKNGKDSFITLGRPEKLGFIRRIRLTLQHFLKKHFGPIFGRYEQIMPTELEEAILNIKMAQARGAEPSREFIQVLQKHLKIIQDRGIKLPQAILDSMEKMEKYAGQSIPTA